MLESNYEEFETDTKHCIEIMLHSTGPRMKEVKQWSDKILEEIDIHTFDNFSGSNAKDVFRAAADVKVEVVKWAKDQVATFFSDATDAGVELLDKLGTSNLVDDLHQQPPENDWDSTDIAHVRSGKRKDCENLSNWTGLLEQARCRANSIGRFIFYQIPNRTDSHSRYMTP